MSSNDQSEQYRQYAEQLIRHLVEDGGAGGTIGPEGLSLGIPNWEEGTKDLRASERVKTHGYPLGFAKSQWHLRDRLRERRQREISGLPATQLLEELQVHEAVARALDTERLLGSFNYAGDDQFPVEVIDLVADKLLLWLDHQGYRVVPKTSPSADEPLPDVESKDLPTVFDIARGALVLWREIPNTEPVEQLAEDVTDEEDEVEGCPRCGGTGCEVCRDQGGLTQKQVDELCKNCGGEGCEQCGYVECPLCRHLPSPGCDACHETSWIKEEDLHEATFQRAGWVRCAYCEGSGCDECEELGWWSEEEVTERLGERRMTCLVCDEGWTDGPGPVSWMCKVCLGTRQMSVESLSDWSHRLTAANLSGNDLSGLNFSDDDLSDADLSEANLSGANLSRATLTGTILEGTDLSGANLTGSNIEDASGLRATCLKDVIGLTDAQRQVCTVEGAWFRSAREMAAPGVDWSDVCHGLRRVDLHGLDLTGADLTGSDLTGADLSGSNLTEARLTGANLSETNLTNAILRGVTLTDMNLDGANLSGVDLARMNFSGASMVRANLAQTNLTDALLSGATLHQADLTAANLTGANLTGADLSKAQMTGTNLATAGVLFGANLVGAVGLPLGERLACVAKGAIGFTGTRPQVAKQAVGDDRQTRREHNRGSKWWGMAMNAHRDQWNAAMVSFSERYESSTEALAIVAAMQALAEALDNEAFLTMGSPEPVRLKANYLEATHYADLFDIAEHLLVWLNNQGFEIRARGQNAVQEIPVLRGTQTGHIDQ